MTYVRSRKFCCCLPVRLGVLIIGILGLIGGSLIAFAGVIQARRIKGDEAYLILQIMIYALLAILSLFGLIGAIIKRRKLVLAYFMMLTAHFIFSLSSGAYSLFRLFRDEPTLIKNCINGSDSNVVISNCKQEMTLTKWVIVALFSVVWLVEIWGCVIVKNYCNQLAEEEEEEDSRLKAKISRPQW